MTFKFSDIIDDYLRREDRPFPIGEYHPHEIGHCLRWNYYKRLIPRPVPPKKLRLFKSADLAHGFIRDVLAASDKVRLVSWEKPFEIPCGGFKIVGRYDDLITVKIAGEDMPIVVEVKSVSGKTVEHIRHPKPPHVYQLHPYLKATGAPAGQLWYIARDTYEDRTFTVFYDESTMGEVVVRAQLLHDFLTKGELPPSEGRNSRDIRYLCWFCPYWRECRADFNPPSQQRPH